jgi:folate-binding protein YgfZ
VNPRVAPYRDVTAELGDLAVFGPKSRRAVAAATDADEAALGALHPYGHLVTMHGDARVTIARNAELDVEGYEIFAPTSLDPVIRDRLLTAGAIPGSARVWDIARIEAGRPEWGIDMNDATIPQEANFDELGAISYTKGCYTGQETVARVHFRGHVNRFLRRLHFVSASVPPTNAELLDDSGNIVGDVRSVAISPRHGGVALAMVRREVAPGTNSACTMGRGRVHDADCRTRKRRDWLVAPLWSSERRRLLLLCGLGDAVTHHAVLHHRILHRRGIHHLHAGIHCGGRRGHRSTGIDWGFVLLGACSQNQNSGDESNALH